jgi:hypothetical protein
MILDIITRSEKQPKTNTLLLGRKSPIHSRVCLLNINMMFVNTSWLNSNFRHFDFLKIEKREKKMQKFENKHLKGMRDHKKKRFLLLFIFASFVDCATAEIIT